MKGGGLLVGPAWGWVWGAPVFVLSAEPAWDSLSVCTPLTLTLSKIKNKQSTQSLLGSLRNLKARRCLELAC